MSRQESDALEDLNETQRRAVEHGDGPLLIVAGPGSGKTRVVTSRIARLNQVERVPVREMLAVTFTNRAAGEMRQRVWQLLDGLAEGIQIGTFHGFCARTLRHHGLTIGVPPNYTICDYDDQLDAIDTAIWSAELSARDVDRRDVLGAISRAKNNLLGPEEMLKQADNDIALAAAYVRPHYDQVLRIAGALDFDDLLVKALELLEMRGDAFDRTAGRFRHVLVDEFQDTNLVQYRLTKLLTEVHGNVTVVGDPDQAIYSWRAADVRNMQQFVDDFEGTKVVSLDQNYRSSGHILRCAMAEISDMEQRPARSLWTENPEGARVMLVDLGDSIREANFVANEIARLIRETGRPFGDFAVIYRINSQSGPIERALVQEGLPYRLHNGTRFYERAEIRDMLAWLRLIRNGADGMAFRRAVSAPPCGVGDQTLNSLMGGAKELGQPLLTVARRAVATGDPEIPAKVVPALERFIERRDALAETARAMPMSALVRYVFRESGLEARIAQDEKASMKLDNINELVASALQYDDLEPEEALSVFLEDAMLSGGGDDVHEPETADCVTLMTLHAAKGLEFPVVFIAGFDEGLFPMSKLMDDPVLLEEERRVCYVGMTRAQERLYLTRARARFNPKYGAVGPTTPSRFLDPLAPDSVIRFSDAASGADGQKSSETDRGYESTPSDREPIPTPHDSEAPTEQWFAPRDPVWHQRFGQGEIVTVRERRAAVRFQGRAEEVLVSTETLTPVEIDTPAAA